LNQPLINFNAKGSRVGSPASRLSDDFLGSLRIFKVISSQKQFT